MLTYNLYEQKTSFDLRELDAVLSELRQVEAKLKQVAKAEMGALDPRSIEWINWNVALLPFQDGTKPTEMSVLYERRVSLADKAYRLKEEVIRIMGYLGEKGE